MSSKRRRFGRRGVDLGLALIVGIAVGTAQALGAFHKSEIEKWWPIITA